MKIRNFTICFTLILLTTLFVGCSGPITKNNEDSQILTKEEACNIALTHVGLSTDQVKFLQAEYDWDNGVPHYEVEFYKDKTQYDYNIHAKTGEILTVEKEWND
jgi:uncharacterized membrane protein YkoI